MNKQKLTYFFLIASLFFLFSCGKKEDVKNVNNNTTNQLGEEVEQVNFSLDSIGGDLESLNKNFGEVTSSGNLKKLSESIKNSDFVETQKIIPIILKEYKENKKDLTQEDKQKIQILEIVNIGAILNEGNYFYKEQEKSQEAVKYIEDIILEDPDYIDPVYKNYYLGYAHEIIKKYAEAVKYYDEALKYASDIDKNNRIRSMILNQKGHLFDLQGKPQEAFKLYTQSYELDNSNYLASVNIGRYLARNGFYENSIKYFKYGLNTEDKILRSEIYFSLSSIELEINSLNPDIDKSIDYAKKSIEEYINYPMGYIALARGYYMFNDAQYYNQIEENLNKSILVNKNAGYEVYKIFGLYFFDRKDYLGYNFFLSKSQEVLEEMSHISENEKDFLFQEIELTKTLFNIMIGGEEEDIIKMLHILSEKNIGKHIIGQQLKRKNNGIFEKFQGKPEFNLFFNLK